MKLSSAGEMRTAEVWALTLTRSDSPIDLQDEVLSHRLGLVPVRVDPDLFESKSGWSAAITRISISVSFSDRHRHLLAVWPP